MVKRWLSLPALADGARSWLLDLGGGVACRQGEGDRLCLAGLHAGEDRRRLQLLHMLEHVEQNGKIELLEDARSLLGLHRLIDLDQALDLGVVLLILLLEGVVDRALHLLELGDLVVDPLFGCLQQRFVTIDLGGTLVELVAALRQRLQDLDLLRREHHGIARGPLAAGRSRLARCRFRRGGAARLCRFGRLRLRCGERKDADRKPHIGDLRAEQQRGGSDKDRQEARSETHGSILTAGLEGAAQQPLGARGEIGDARGIERRRRLVGRRCPPSRAFASKLDRPLAGNPTARRRLLRLRARRPAEIVAAGSHRALQPIGKAAAQLDDVGEIAVQPLALIDALLELLADPLGRVLERGNTRLGALRGGIEAAHQRFELLLVVAQCAEAAAEQHCIGDSGEQKPRDDNVENNVQRHEIPRILSTFSSMRTAMLPPLRPIRPENIGTSPHRSAISDCGVALSGMRVPTCQLMTSRSEYSKVSRTACSGTLVFHSSPARCASQIESRPNFSPMNIWRRSSRTGSSVAYGSRSSRRPPRSSISTRMRASTAAFAGRAIVAKRGLVSSRSKRKLTGLSGSKAEDRSERTTATMRSTRLRSIVV